MRKYLFLFTLLSAISLQAKEFFIISDEDGYVNVRDNDNNVTDRLSNGSPVFVLNPMNEEMWWEVEYSKAGVLFTGKVHQSKLKNIDNFEEIPVANKVTNRVLMQNNVVRVNIEEAGFEKAGHTFQYQAGFLIYIDHSKIWGTDGKIPHREYSAIDISINNRKVILPEKAFKDLYEPNLDYTKAYYHEETDTLYISTLNSDGAGGYVVLWLFRNGIFEDRLVTHGF